VKNELKKIWERKRLVECWRGGREESNDDGFMENGGSNHSHRVMEVTSEEERQVCEKIMTSCRRWGWKKGVGAELCWGESYLKTSFMDLDHLFPLVGSSERRSKER